MIMLCPVCERTFWHLYVTRAKDSFILEAKAIIASTWVRGESYFLFDVHIEQPQRLKKKIRFRVRFHSV